MVLEIAEWITLGLAVALIVSGVIFIRQRAPRPGSVTHAVLATNAVFVIATVVAACGAFSPLHRLWAYPVSCLTGFLTRLPPFAWVLRPLAIIYGRLCCL